MKRGKQLSDKIVAAVRTFYMDDGSTQMMSVQKDCLTARDNG